MPVRSREVLGWAQQHICRLYPYNLGLIERLPLLYFSYCWKRSWICFWRHFTMDCPSVHPLSSTYLGSHCSGSRLSRVVQTSTSPTMLSSSLWGSLRHSQARWDIETLQRVLGLPQGLLPGGRAWKTSNGRRPGGIPIRCPNQLSLLLSTRRSTGSTPSSLQRSELLTLSAQPEETLFGSSCPQSHSFCHYPDIMTLGEGWDIDWLVNQELCLMA